MGGVCSTKQTPTGSPIRRDIPNDNELLGTCPLQLERDSLRSASCTGEMYIATVFKTTPRLHDAQSGSCGKLAHYGSIRLQSFETDFVRLRASCAQVYSTSGQMRSLSSMPDDRKS